MLSQQVKGEEVIQSEKVIALAPAGGVGKPAFDLGGKQGRILLLVVPTCPGIHVLSTGHMMPRRQMALERAGEDRKG